MEKITFECEVVTPMFLAGANQGSFELRPPSLKGALRFWWRAMHGNLNLEDLKEKETEIFGGGGDDARKSRFSIIIKNSNLIGIRNDFPNRQNTINVRFRGRQFPINILHYMAYGVNEYQKGRGQVIIRDYLETGNNFKIELNFNSLITSSQKQEVIDSLLLTSLIGGIGSRSRNGFGKFLVKDSNYNEQYMVSLIKKFNHNKSMWTSISDETQIYKYDEDFSSWDRALAEISKIYRNARISLDQQLSFEKRQRIAAPINMVTGKRVSDLERHSKPLFITVIKDLNTNLFNSYIILMPYNYLNTYLSEKKKIDPKRLNQMRKEFDEVMNELKDKFSSSKKLKEL